MRSHLGSRDAKRLTVVWALSPETGLLRSPAGSARWPEPRAGSSRGLARLGGLPPLQLPPPGLGLGKGGKVSSCLIGQNDGDTCFVPNRHLAAAGHDLGGSQFSDTNGRRDPDVRGAVLARKTKAEQKRWRGAGPAPTC